MAKFVNDKKIEKQNDGFCNNYSNFDDRNLAYIPLSKYDDVDDRYYRVNELIEKLEQQKLYEEYENNIILMKAIEKKEVREEKNK